MDLTTSRSLNVMDCDDHGEDSGYRTCSECGRDCEPEVTALDGLGGRITFVCAAHGAHSIIDPFENWR